MQSIWDEDQPVLLLDSGDLFGNRSRVDQQTSRFLCKVTETFGYDGIGLGERDLNYGLPFLKEMVEEFNLPFTNANVRDPDTGELILPEYLIVEKNGITFGICSVLDPKQKIITMTSRDAPFEVADPIATLRELVPRLREKCDTVVLLSHLADRGTEECLKEVKGVNICVTGHSFRNLKSERIFQKVVMLGAVHEGRFIGRADIGINTGSGVVQSVSVTNTSLDEAIADDPVVAQMIVDFKGELEAYKLAQRAKFPRNLGSEKESYLGEGTCKKCHTAEWSRYVESAHRRAFPTVRTTGMDKEPECLVCHTTGYRHYNGYDDDNRQFAHLKNVQCEACHGYGTEHSREGKWSRKAADSCLDCHDREKRSCPDKDKGPEFEYETYWAGIKH